MADLVIEDNVVVPYPADELKDLRKIIRLDGVLKAIITEKNIPRPTTKRIAQTGQGQRKNVLALRDFVKQFNRAVA